MSGRETEMFENEHRRGDDPSCHYMGCSCPILYDQYWQTSDVFSRSSDEVAVSTFKTVGEVDIHLGANTQWPVTQGPQEPASRGSTMADSNKCGVEIKAPENQKDLVRSDTNRKQECQKTNNKVTSGSRFREPSSLSSGREWEFEKESGSLAVRELCRNEHMVLSVITETHQNLCNRNNDTRNETTLLKLPNDHETEHTLDLPSLLKLLKNKQPYRDETNKNVLNDFEIGLFAGTYGITDFCLLLACEDSVFWLEDHDGVIYFWSRIDDSMIRGGDNLKEALTNYLFHQENLYYVDEITRKLVPINAYDKEAEEWAKSPEAYINIDDIDVTKGDESDEDEIRIYYESLRKTGIKKKQQKKKKNKKNKNKR